MTALDFPDSPSNGDRFDVWKWVSARSVWDWNVVPAPYDVQYVVVAGGGGGGSGFTKGAGGAGGYRSNVTGENTGGGLSAESPLALLAGTYTVTVGAGGSVQTGDGSKGSNSVFASVTSEGGGFGQGDTTSGGAGGSGGGGQGSSAARPGGAGTSGQGFDGGDGFHDGNNLNQASGGGGGAGAVGASGAFQAGGLGGSGVTSSITGSAIARAGGGGGGARNGETAGAGQAGGGAGSATTSAATAGTANTGGGGGGSGENAAGGAGGSGVVIFSLSTQAIVTFSGGVTQTSAIVGVNKVYTVTATSDALQTFTIV